MDERVAGLRTPEECAQFAINVAASHPDLARQAQRRAVELRAAAHAAVSAAETEALQAVYAYEEALAARKGKRVLAARTWQMITRHGIIRAVERAVDRKEATLGYTTLVAMGMQDLAFEAVVCRYPEVFSPRAVTRSQERLRDWESCKA